MGSAKSIARKKRNPQVSPNGPPLRKAQKALDSTQVVRTLQVEAKLFWRFACLIELQNYYRTIAGRRPVHWDFISNW
ncbi:unnamed protein product [Calypogeia fissa]